MRASSIVISGHATLTPAEPEKMGLAPCTANTEAAREFLSNQLVEERELPHCRGDNPEQIAFLENDSELTDHLPADMPYHVLFDENCDGDTEYCDKVLQWLPELIRRLSRVGTGGEFTWVKGAGQEIESSRPDLVLAAVDEMFERRSHSSATDAHSRAVSAYIPERSRTTAYSP